VVARPVAPGGAPSDPGAPRRDSRRAEILDAFTRAVAERGYDGTNFGDLAAGLGISKGTIVHHFGTKDRMLRELHENYMRRRLAEVRIVWARLTRPSQRLAAFVHLGVRYQVVDRIATVAFQREVRRFAAAPGMETSLALRDEYRRLVERVLAEGVAAGEFRPGDDRLRTLQLFGSVHWMWTWFDPDGARPVEDVAASFVDMVLAGVLADPSLAGEFADPAGTVAAAVEEALRGGAAGDHPEGLDGDVGHTPG
jgi:TetR/AcrR family transcriptional regulator, cholesterol catabolism regulator